MKLEFGELRDADGDVDSLLDRVDEAVAQRQLDLEVGKLRHEFGDRGPQIERSERRRAVDLEDPSRLAVQARHLHFSLFDARENLDAAIVVGEARLARPYAPRGAVEQPDAEQMLQLHHRLAGRRAGRAQGARRFGETAERHHLGEGVHRAELVHRLVPNWRQAA